MINVPVVGSAAFPGISFARTNSGIPFKTAKPDYSTFLPSSGDYAGDPTPTMTIDWRNLANDDAGPFPGTSSFAVGTQTGQWRVTQSDYGGIAVGALYGNMSAAVVAMGAVKSGTLIVDVPVGSVLRDTILNGSLDYHIIVRFPVDEDGIWGVTIGRGTSETVALNSDTGANGIIDVRNCRIGPSDAVVAASANDGYQEGTDAVLHKAACIGNIYLRNAKVWRAGADGLNSQSDSGDFYKWANDARFCVWDTELEFNGNNLEHNAYIHSVNLALFVRVFSHSVGVGGSHCLKLDCGSAIAIDSTFKMNHPDASYPDRSYGEDRVVNISQNVDAYFENCVFDWEPNNGSRHCVEMVCRSDSMSGVTPKRPPPLITMLPASQGGVALANVDEHIEWLNSGTTSSSHSVGQPSATLSTSQTSISVRRVSPEFCKTLSRDLTGTTEWDIGIFLNAGSWHETTATLDSASSGNADFTLAVGMPSAAGNLNAVRMKPTGSSWDVPTNLHPPMWNPADANYYWPTIKDESGNIDWAVRDKYPVHIFNNCFFYPRASIGSVTFIQTQAIIFRSHWATQNQSAMLPAAPLNNPEGATGGWPDDGGYGNWTGAPEGQYPQGATLPSVVDTIHHYPLMVRDIGYNREHVVTGEFQGEFNSNGSAESEYITEWMPNAWAVDPDGSLVRYALEDEVAVTHFAPVQFQLTAGADADAVVLILNDTTGMNVGDRIHLYADIDNAQGRVGDDLITRTIDSVDSGTQITLTSGIPRAALSGDAGCAFEASVDPSDWDSADEYYDSIGPR